MKKSVKNVRNERFEFRMKPSVRARTIRLLKKLNKDMAVPMTAAVAYETVILPVAEEWANEHGEAK